MAAEKRIEVRDARNRHMYRVDDEYLNGYARLCGVYATVVYNSLCRHVDTNQECFPSIEKIAEQHAINRKTVLSAIKALEEWGIVVVKKRKDEKTKRQLVNVYQLTDKSSWKPKPSPSQGLGAESVSRPDPSPSHGQKPGPSGGLEGYTGEKDTQRRVVAPSATVPVSAQTSCGYGNGSECRKEPIRGLRMCKMHQPMNGDEFVAWYRKSEKRYIRLIAEFADEVKPKTCETVAQWEAWAACHYRAAQKIAPFSDDQIAIGIERVKTAKYLTSWNLETLLKFIVNVEVQK